MKPANLQIASPVAISWNALMASFLGWMLDAFDFFVVVMVLTEVGAAYDRSVADVALTLTVTLAFRPVGAFIFGLLADKYGRRIPLMVDVIAYSIIEVASGLAPNFATFMVLRALFGIAMGGEWGVGASLAMESVPAKWRGVLSGLLQQGYACGYLLASFAYLFVLPVFGWRALFFLGGAPALLALFIRSKVRESEVWEKTRRKDWSQLWMAVRSHSKFYVMAGVAAVLLGAMSGSSFLRTPAGMAALFVSVLLVFYMMDMTWKVAAGHRKVFFYLVLFLTFMGFTAHGTQDMYPTFLKTQRQFSPQAAGLMTMLANLGALVGGVSMGLCSDRVGRRKSIMIALTLGVLIIPLWAYSPRAGLLAAGAFLLQFMVQGAWGVVPAYITELSPDHIRGFLPGFAYQCGMLFSGAIVYIEAVLAHRTSYANAMALTALVVFVGATIVVGLGQEKHGIEFGQSPS